MTRGAVRVEFVKGEGRRYRSRLHRADGVVVEFEGGAWNKVGGRPGELPHDLAHLIVEDELGLREGVWGVLAAGGMFRHATVVAGRRAPQATRRGRDVIDEAGDDIMQAEILTRVVCDACAGALAPAPGGSRRAAAEHAPDPAALRRAAGERWWDDALTTAALDRCRERLRAAAAEWAALAPGAALEAAWSHAAPARPAKRR
ncbi:MAG TPA: hypothetical protein VLK58_27295 [Conexibacter sp.]|nr:hypothetical protein [Conexibacter sp.]